MSYDNEKLKYGKEKINIIEIDIDYCPLGSGVNNSAGSCSATETGDNKCFNTLETCNSISSYNTVMSPSAETKTYRFCESRSPHPIGLDAIPSLKNINISPTKIDLKGGLGVRASVNLSFNDHPSNDLGIDKYINDRSYVPSDRGTYWTKLRARNPNYENRALRVLSGYLVDGIYDPANFTTRYYITDKMNVTGGMASITAKDPLKLASSKKVQAPTPSTGQLLANLASSGNTATLTPSGVGSEYPTTGKVLINSEVMSFTRSGDDLDFTARAENNTVLSAHSANDTVQLCLEYIDKKVSFIAFKLLNDFAGIEIDLFDLDGWSAEVNAFLPGTLSGIITKPTDVFKLLVELAEAMPHYLWWDERQNLIRLTALKIPPLGSDVIDMNENIIADSFKTTDKPELRLSTVYLNFGQYDPTKELTDASNYQQTYARIDTNSINKYGVGNVKTIYSRWIANDNAFAAQNAAKLIGRRFSDTPREVNFSLEDKDSDFWTGQTVNVNHRDIVDFSGTPTDTIFQIMTAKEGASFNYTALEFKYGDTLPNEPVDGVVQVPLSGTLKNINLRTLYNSNVGVTPVASTKVVFYIEDGTKIGSTSTSTYAVDTGSWPELVSGAGGEITLQLVSNSFIVGKGGNGSTSNGSFGGSAIILNHDLTINNSGVIGGGGGGGGGGVNGGATAGGGGGAGEDVGVGAGSTGLYFVDGANGTLENGGAFGDAEDNSANTAEGGSGGSLGQAGNSGDTGSGGAAGNAINKNGKTLAYSPSSDIRGAVVG